MTQSMIYRICTLVVACMISLTAYAEQYETWHDSTYDFSHIHTLYMDNLDTSSVQTDSPMQTYRLKEAFQKKAAAMKGISIVMPVLESPVPSAVRYTDTKTKSAQPIPASPQSVEIKHATASDPAANIPSDATSFGKPAKSVTTTAKVVSSSTPLQTPAPVIIPQEAMDAKADAYVTAQLLAYQVGTGLIPAHTEWNSYSVRDVYYDRDGHPHWFYHDVSYPVYVPDAYVPIATVRVRFAVYDVKTGKLISYSEDARTRGSSDDLRGVYQRILDRFFKNLKKEIQK